MVQGLILKAGRRLIGALVVGLCLSIAVAQATSPPQDNKSYRGDMDGDFVVSLSDVNAARDRSLLRSVDYTAVVPGDAIKGDTADISGDAVVDLFDLNVIKDIALLKNYSTPDLPWSLDTTGIPANINDSASIQAAVTNIFSAGRPGIVVRFSVASGPATLSGREYNPANDGVRDHAGPPGATQVLAITLTDFPGGQTGATELTIPTVGTPVELICTGDGVVTLDVNVLADTLKGIPALSATVPVTCSVTPECSDGSDNDGDTLTDFPSDPGCTSATDASEYLGTECDDGVDNDGDTLTDFPSDPGCSAISDINELGTNECDDGVDNDGDTAVDYPNDPGCATITDIDELGTNECDDSVDNDGDTLIDWPADPECSGLTDTSEFLSGNWVLYASFTSSDYVNKIDEFGMVENFYWVNEPQGLAVGPDGYVYVCGRYSGELYKVDPSGSGSLFASGLGGCTDLIFDSFGMLYSTDYNSDTIYKIDTDGSVSTFVTGINGPEGITIDKDDNLYVSSYLNNRIVKIDPYGTQSVFFSYTFLYPYDLSFDSAGNLYVASMGNYDIYKISPDGNTFSFFALMPMCFTPRGLEVDKTDDRVYASCWNDGNIYWFDSAGVPTFLADASGVTLSLPQSWECNDGTDNDGDTLTDFPSDPSCTTSTDRYEGTNECDDGIDNDGDTLVDYPDDPHCFRLSDDLEATSPECSDRVDNDGDTLTDFPEDTGCIDVSDTIELGGITLGALYGEPGGYSAHDVFIKDGIAYVAYGAIGLRILDVSIPFPLALLGLYDTPGEAYDIFVSGSYAYVADGISGLQIIDVSVPTSPAFVGSYNTPWLALGVYVSGDYAYVADASSGLQIIDISVPSLPVLAGIYNTPGSAFDVEVIGNYAYVADGSSGLQIIDVTLPSSPTLAGFYDTPGHSDGVSVNMNKAYVADGNFGLQIIDVTSASSPTFVGTYDTPGWSEDVFIAGSYVYMADGDSGFHIIDVLNPASPNLRASFQTWGYATGIFISGKYAYVTDGDFPQGLLIFNLDTNAGDLTECSDWLDNDGDTLVDFPNDPNCTNTGDPNEGTNECDDGIDNDGDTAIDFPGDPGCVDIFEDDERGNNMCDNGFDNDGDTLIDLADPGCEGGITDNTETNPTGPACDDGIDNDGDTVSDTRDPACLGDATGVSEIGECQDGLDNDADTVTDYPADPGCINILDYTEIGDCQDALDNDGDTLTDFPSDPECQSDSDASEMRKISSDIRITNDPGSSQVPSMVWTGSEYGVSWVGMYFARIDASGIKIGADVLITSTPEPPTLVWTGTEYGVSWEHGAGFRDDEIYFARTDAYGNKIGADMRVTVDPSNSVGPSLVWTGTEYGVSWSDTRDANSEVYFARIDASGNKIGADMRITNDPAGSGSTSLVWTGSEYGVSWQDDREGNDEIYFARIDASGNKIGADVRISNAPGSSQSPSLVWTGTEYGVSWQDDREGFQNDEIYFARIDSSGNKIGTSERITNFPKSSWWPSLVWTGTEYGVSWNDERDGINSEIYFARIDSSGNKIGADERITNGPGASRWPSLVWTGTEYGVSWCVNRDGNWEIYFARIE